MQTSAAILFVLVATATPTGAARVKRGTRSKDATSAKHEMQLDTSTENAGKLDRDGFCVPYTFGGGKGSSPVQHLDKEFVMVKVFWAEHLPSGGGYFSEDIPDLYIKFSVDGQEAQTRLVEDSFSPLFGSTCWFTFAGDADLQMDLFEHDRKILGFGKDHPEGHIGLQPQQGVALGSQFRKEHCHDKGECSVKFVAFGSDYHPLVGKDGERTTVSVAFKFVNPLPQSDFGLPKIFPSSLSQTMRTALSQTNAVDLADGGNEATRFDKDGFCPEFSIGGNDPHRPFPEKLVMIKIIAVTDLPNGGGTFKTDDPDLYIKFEIDGHEAQTNVVYDDYNPMFHFGCYFPYSGTPDFKSSLWERDDGMFNSDDFFGSSAIDDLKDQGQVPLDDDWVSKCNTPEGPGECYHKVGVWKGLDRLIGDNGQPTHVHLAFKFVDPMPKGFMKAPLSLGM